MSSNTTSGGVSFCGLLFITFLVLKLTEVIDWSWWWVTAPLWGGVALIFGILVLCMIAISVYWLFKLLFYLIRNK